MIWRKPALARSSAASKPILPNSASARSNNLYARRSLSQCCFQHIAGARLRQHRRLRKICRKPGFAAIAGDEGEWNLQRRQPLGDRKTPKPSILSSKSSAMSGSSSTIKTSLGIPSSAVGSMVSGLMIECPRRTPGAGLIADASPRARRRFPHETHHIERASVCALVHINREPDRLL
jgi:hypothetical protein